MSSASTILFPFARGYRFAQLAIESLCANSSHEHALLVGVEPLATEEDRAWLATLEARWPGEARVIYHDEVKGAYGNPNELVRQCTTPVAIWFTTDQVAGPGWDEHLLAWLKPGRFVTGRLVEAGATLIADRTIWKCFGVSPEVFKREAFEAFCRSYAPSRPLDIPRHYIPMAFHVEDFVRMGMFPEGADTSAVRTVRSDLDFLVAAVRSGMEVVEVQRALTYHFQSGSKRTGRAPSGWLNYVYPLGLRWLHRLCTGYESLYDTLKAEGAEQTIQRILSEENTEQPV